jgi:hypothetical protein
LVGEHCGKVAGPLGRDAETHQLGGQGDLEYSAKCEQMPVIQPCR